MMALFVCICTEGSAQRKRWSMAVFSDSSDHAFDLSSFLIDMHGFVPVPIVITEPAFGGFGFGLVPVFLTRRAPVADTVGGRLKIKATPPDITGMMALYTANKTWVAMAFRSATWQRARSQYRLLGGYANVNLSFYRVMPDGSEGEFKMNLQTMPAYGQLLRQWRSTNWRAGLQYLFTRTEVKPDGESLPTFITEQEIESTVSLPGVVVELDSRDNIFTPNHGVRFHTSVSWSTDAFGSDYEYVNVNSYAHAYFPFGAKVIGGFRLELQEAFNDPPFYLLPFVNLRGVPTARYQGNICPVAEVECRWDVVPRWSAVAFAGAAKAYDAWNEFDDASWVNSGGAGFRYLVARAFKLRCGIDVARGPEQWAYYIVFGSAWLR